MLASRWTPAQGRGDEIKLENLSMRAAFLAAMALTLGAASPPPLPIHLNQIGFEPGDAKIAIVWGGSAPLAWTLFDANGNAVERGQARLLGQDAASGAEIQRIDF